MAVYTSDYTNTITSLRRGNIQDAIRELESRDRLTIALREALQYGTDINDLSEASGLTVDEIRRRTNRELFILSELELLAG